jgi:hypothetical protein
MSAEQHNTLTKRITGALVTKLPYFTTVILPLLIVASLLPVVQSMTASALPYEGAGSVVRAWDGRSRLARSCTTSSGEWQSYAMPAQGETLTVLLDATPHQANLEGVIGLSAQPALADTDLAVSVRFNAQGLIDASNGAAYEAATPFAYAAGETYRFRLVIHVPSHTYDLFLMPPDGDAEVLGTNFAFRPEQQHAPSVRYWALYAPSGSLTICNVVPNPPDFGGTWEGSIAQGGAISFFVSPDNTVLDGSITLDDRHPCWREVAFGPARISNQHFADQWKMGTARITVTGRFNSRDSVSGSYVVIDTTPGSSCHVNVIWTATKTRQLQESGRQYHHD